MLKQTAGKGKEGKSEMKELEMPNTKTVNFRFATGITIHKYIKCILCSGRVEKQENAEDCESRGSCCRFELSLRD